MIKRSEKMLLILRLRVYFGWDDDWLNNLSSSSYPSLYSKLHFRLALETTTWHGLFVLPSVSLAFILYWMPLTYVNVIMISFLFLSLFSHGFIVLFLFDDFGYAKRTLVHDEQLVSGTTTTWKWMIIGSASSLSSSCNTLSSSLFFLTFFPFPCHCYNNHFSFPLHSFQTLSFYFFLFNNVS